jgi:EAL domain-containing protein (putative c-di-GMP-specific phosphodiesterase class I)
MSDPVDEMLDVIRAHLGMDVAFVSAFDAGRRVFRHVASAAPQDQVRVGEGHDLESTYCTRIVSGALAPLTRDATADAEVADLPLTGQLGIRAYAGVPIPLPDGQVYGTLCAYSHGVHDFRDEDVHALELAAALIAHRLAEHRPASLPDVPPPDRALIRDAAGSGVLTMAFQPIVGLRNGEVQGHEALARFAHERIRQPADWFAMARRIGLDVQLQRDAAALALQQAHAVDPGRFLSVNLSDDALLDDGVHRLLLTSSPEDVVVELTEHQTSGEDEAVLRAIAELRAEGIRFAVDDVGTGYAGLERILSVAPELIKLDRSLVVGIWDDPGRQAMVQALATFARAVEAEVVAEGIEAQPDADALRILGVAMGQGFLLGRPQEALQAPR